ncbi:probable aspartyl aminopeptidase [Tanacetum coccineum]
MKRRTILKTDEDAKRKNLGVQMLPTHAGCKLGDRDGCMVIIRGADVSLEDERGARMVALFDHEEARTTSAQGARSPVMFDALNLISTFFSSNPQKSHGNDLIVYTNKQNRAKVSD